MRPFCSALVVSALMAAAPAYATLQTYSVKGALTAEWSPVSSELSSLYQLGTPFRGIFTIDDAIPDAGYSDSNWYHGAFSGTFQVGANVVSVSNSLVYTYSNQNYSTLTMLGGNAWGTGGAVADTHPVDGWQFNGLQLRFFYPGGRPMGTPVKTWLADANPQSGSFYLNYVDAAGRSVGDWWQVTELTQLSPVPEPSSSVLFLSGGAILLTAGLRRRRRNQMAEATGC